MQLSVIILNYNVRYFLEQCVLSVLKAIEQLDAEIIVVDNDSHDDSCTMLAQRFPNVRLIRNNSNLGFPKGNNLGVAAAEGDYICILNPDTVVAEDTFTKVLEFANKQNDVGIVGVRLIDGTGNFLPESKRGIPTPFVAFTKITALYKLLPKLFGQYYAQHLPDSQTGKVDILVGAFMLMKRDLYSEVGGFDENCFMYSDDIDLSYMVLKSGRSNYYFADTTVIHYKGESTVKDHTYMKRFAEAMNFFYKKHFRVSKAFDVFMRIGTFFFTLHKKQSTPPRTQMPTRYVLLTTDQMVRQKVENFFGKICRTHDGTVENALNSFLPNDEIIFDNNVHSFKSIISQMQMLKDRGLTFKILPDDSDFIIGSNSSNDRGQVIALRPAPTSI